MKTLSIAISLLLTSHIYCLDTLSIKPNIQGIKTDTKGTTVYQFINLPTELGSYVLHIKDLPKRFDNQDLKIEAKGVDIVEINWDSKVPSKNASSNQELYEQMMHLKDKLKELDHQENEELKFKKELLKNMVNSKDINSIKELYKEKDIAFKKERLSIYHQLEMIQSEISILNSMRADPNNDSQATLFLSIVKYHLDAKILKFNYFLSHPRPDVKKPSLQKDSQLVKGRVIESNSRIPMIYALVEIYKGKELIQSIYTNEKGIFEIKLATNRAYSFVIYQEGYRNRKVKSFQAKASYETNYRTFTLKEKDPISVTEFASYALQVVSLIAVNW